MFLNNFKFNRLSRKCLSTCFVILIVFLFLADILWQLTLPILAQSATAKPLDITATPTLFDLSSDPGKTIKNKIRLRNNSEEAVTLQLELKKLAPKGDQGDAAINDFEDTDEHKNWVEFDVEPFTAPPREWIDIPFEIAIPEEAIFAYYWAFYLTPAELDAATDNSNQLTGALAIPVLLRINSTDANVEGAITEFKTDKAFYEYVPVKFGLTYSNSGNVHVKPVGNIFIKDWKGKEVEVLKINEGAGNVLPESIRKFESIWNNSFITLEEKIENGVVVKDDKGNVKRELQYHFDKVLDLRVGKYTARAIIIVNNGEKDIPMESITTFTIVPWKIILGLIVFALFAFIGVANTLKSIFSKVMLIFKRK